MFVCLGMWLCVVEPMSVGVVAGVGVCAEDL